MGNRFGGAGMARAVLFLAAFALCSAAAWTHHGWAWATDEEFEISGVVVEAKLGNPHGEVTIRVGAELWLVEVGQPYRNEAAGLRESLLVAGTAITVHGHRSARRGELVVKAERVVIQGRSFDLYPDRDS